MGVFYVNNNGTILPDTSPTIMPKNRSYMYGDGVFETIRVMNGSPVNIENHISRLLKGAAVLGIQTPDFYTASFFQERILELLQKSGITKGGKCRLSIDREVGGTYLPKSNDSNFYIEVEDYGANFFELNAKGLAIDIYSDIKLHKNFLSNYKTKSCLVYVMAALNAKERNLDDLFLSDVKGNILETSSSNVFVVSNGVLYTPGLDEGCLAGTMRMQVINLALKYGMKVYECSILPQNLLSADEVFITNAVRGINWIGSYRTKKFSNTMARKLIISLNEFWRNKLEN
jgi:branched-chain amino acid aminotransferase